MRMRSIVQVLVVKPVAHVPVLAYVVQLIGISPCRTPAIESVVPSTNGRLEARISCAVTKKDILLSAWTALAGPGVGGHVSCDRP